jgi:hypothetical protein
MSHSLLGRGIQKVLASQASRALQMKRTVRFMVADAEQTGRGSLVQGMYQSPILVQWNRAESQKRRLEVTFYRFE